MGDRKNEQVPELGTIILNLCLLNSSCVHALLILHPIGSQTRSGLGALDNDGLGL